MPVPSEVLTMLRAYRSSLEARFGERLVDVRLFGSRARGDADETSDVDVAVVVRGLTEAERSAAIDLALDAWRANGRGPVPSPLVWSEEEHADRLRAERRIALDIEREGVSV